MIRSPASALGAAVLATTLLAAPAAAGVEEPVAGKQVRYEQGYWAGVPKIGSDGKVLQCILVASRERQDKAGPRETHLSVAIGRGAGFAFLLNDPGLAPGTVLDDQAEVILDGGPPMPAVGFDVGGTAFALHPGEPVKLIAALWQAKTLTLRAAGAGIDTGAMTLDLPREAILWLTRCGEKFAIPVDRPSDPKAGPLPTPRPLSPRVSAAKATSAGPAGIEDKQKISGWDASELRVGDGTVSACLIRQHYGMISGDEERRLAVFFTASRSKGLTMMLKDSGAKLTPGAMLDAKLVIGGKWFPGLEAQALSATEIGIFPKQPAAFAAAFDGGRKFQFKSKAQTFEGPVPTDIMPWLRACARRHGFGLAAASP